MATFKLTIGNPKPKNGVGITRSPEGSPYIGGLEANNGSKLLYDNAGNVFLEASKTLFIKGKTIFEELENSNTVITNAHTINALTIALSAIESIFISGVDTNIRSTNLHIEADTTAELLCPRIVLGKVNTDILEGVADGELYEDDEQLYNENSNPDPLMTKRKFSKWWSLYMGGFVDDFYSLVDKVNAHISDFKKHTHNGAVPVPSEQPSKADAPNAGKVRSVASMQASKTTSAI